MDPADAWDKALAPSWKLLTTYRYRTGQAWWGKSTERYRTEMSTQSKPVATIKCVSQARRACGVSWIDRTHFCQITPRVAIMEEVWLGGVA